MSAFAPFNSIVLGTPTCSRYAATSPTPPGGILRGRRAIEDVLITFTDDADDAVIEGANVQFGNDGGSIVELVDDGNGGFTAVGNFTFTTTTTTGTTSSTYGFLI